MKILASLPMYDWPEIRLFTDQFWAGLARHAGVMGVLNHSSSYDAIWRSPELYFSQACGYPLTHEFKDLLNYVATPHYAADGCEGTSYRSIIFAQKHSTLGDLRGVKAAINSIDSMSGFLALKLVFAPWSKSGDFFTTPLITGSHLASMAAVQNGAADICAIDCICVALAKKYRPETLQGLVEIARSPSVPALPFVTRAGDISRLRLALHQAFGDPKLQAAREALLLSDVSVLPDEAHDIILQLEASL